MSKNKCWTAPEPRSRRSAITYKRFRSYRLCESVLPLFRRLPRPSRLQFQRSDLNWYLHSRRLRRTDSLRVSARPGSLRHSRFCRRVRVICSHCFRCAFPVGASLEKGPRNTKGSRPVSLQLVLEERNTKESLWGELFTIYNKLKHLSHLFLKSESELLPRSYHSTQQSRWNA